MKLKKRKSLCAQCVNMPAKVSKKVVGMIVRSRKFIIKDGVITVLNTFSLIPIRFLSYTFIFFYICFRWFRIGSKYVFVSVHDKLLTINLLCVYLLPSSVIIVDLMIKMFLKARLRLIQLILRSNRYESYVSFSVIAL